MPPRYSYWTIIAGGLPTAFRAADREELRPTFERIRQKHPDAEMKWFARGRLWSSPEAARDQIVRPDRRPFRNNRQTRSDGRPDQTRPASGRDRQRDTRPGHGDRQQSRWDRETNNRGRREGAFRPGESRDRPRDSRSNQSDRGVKSDVSRRPHDREHPSHPRSGGEHRYRPGRDFRPYEPRDHRPDSSHKDGNRERKTDVNRRQSQQSERGRDWRPGGDHRDPRQRFKDAKKARNQGLRRERFKHRNAWSKSGGRKPFVRTQGVEEPPQPHRPPGPDREPHPDETPEPAPPPRPNEPVTIPPPPERGRKPRPWTRPGHRRPRS